MYPGVDSRTDQATFVPSYLITTEYSDESHHYYPGAPVSAAISGYTAPAYIATATIQLSPTEYIYVNDLMTADQKNTYMTNYAAVASDIEESVVPAYICTTAGLYGGSFYESGKNYRALEAYSAMSESDRTNFAFNYDALDLLIDPAYGKKADGTQQAQGKKYQYDGQPYTWTMPTINPGDTEEQKAAKQEEIDNMIYSLAKPIDYTATYNSGTDMTGLSGITLKRGASTLTNQTTVTKDDELTREVYESLPNEKRHYAAIKVEPADVGHSIYVVNTSFVHVETPYAVGTTLDSDAYNRLSKDEKEYVTTLTFSSSDMKKDGGGNDITTTFYYCRESYEVNEKGEGHSVTSYKGAGDGSYSNGQVVPIGFVIGATDYETLPNRQLNFTIHGVSPMETSTLYVSRNSDIRDLSTEKIITVIYKYDYEESDVDGMHITPVSERHVVNIHITFKSGVPIIDDINPPSIVLPGTGITMRIPSVTPGAYEVMGGGWELFEKPSDAESHVNGVEYTPNSDSLYWYQDGFYLAYYAKTYLGKTYSNHVPVSVANYHDLKKVMDDKTNHLHIDYDRTRLKRDSKIYINDYSSSSQNGLDLFKNLYDLSLRTTVAESGDLKDHALLNTSTATGMSTFDGQTYTKGVKGGKNLEFFLRTDIAYTDNPATDDWTPIGTDEQCFEGTLHGDGHTISGLDHSLFNNLCGEVYNLGVTGSFNTAGVVDKGTGYVESAWVKSTNTTPLGSKPYAVFGAPSDDKGYQVVNSYYWDGNNGLYNTATAAGVTTSGGDRGKARAMTGKEFYNGTVAYNLNNFYLYKRYSDQIVNSGAVDQGYQFFTINDENTPVLQNVKYYASNPEYCSSGYLPSPRPANFYVPMYVEDRFADGDFRYAAGEIPTSEDERRWIDTEDDNKSYYFPIWPDDYLFFGQKLTYGWAAQAHQSLPSAIVRSDGRLSDDNDANRVYRAPAYFRSKEMGQYYFNPDAYLAYQSEDGTETVTEKPMTAIDFKGHYYGVNEAYGSYGLGTVTDGLPAGKSAFYPPLLDDDGLTSIMNCDETQNLLAYAPSTEDNEQTRGVLASYFTEPIYNNHYDNSRGYRLVAEAIPSDVRGHLVQSDLQATNDHLLVDKQDFNAPLAYTFDAAHLMWYQRTPANHEFVDTEKGWQGISVPFTAELVTTSQKGEITHFYNTDDADQNSQNNTKKGHEYWLREYTGLQLNLVGDTARATFTYPEAAGDNKTVTNSFLWDYYYKNEPVHNQQDANDDTYLLYRHYYENPRTYEGYPLLTAAKPYILGLPGKLYYEFDLSGSFVAENTAVTIDKLSKQVITLASNTGIRVGVSDDEMAGVRLTESASKDYEVTFKPSYMNETLANGNYVMNSDGNAYAKLDDSGTGKYNTTGSRYADAAAFAAAGTLYTDADGTTPAVSWANASTTYYKRVSEISHNDDNNVTPALSAFRPYFTASVTTHSRRLTPKMIVFGGANGEEFEDGPETVLDGSVEIFVRGRNIVAVSHKDEPTAIRIVTLTGITLSNFVLEPGQTVETPVNNQGVYIANQKKLFVK